MITTTVYCSRHGRCEEVATVEQIHRFPVQSVDSRGTYITGEYAVEVHGKLECGRAVHFIGSIGWWG